MATTDSRCAAPANLTAEAALLGVMLLSQRAVHVAAAVVTGTDFYRPANGHIFDAIVTLAQRGEPADPVTVGDELAVRGLLDTCGGHGALLALHSSAPSTSNAERYAGIVAGKARLRRLIDAALEVIEVARNAEDVDEAVSEAQRLILAATPQAGGSDTATAVTAVAEAIVAAEAALERRIDGDIGPVGVSTGLRDLDRITDGLPRGSLTILAARPAMGKTSALLVTALRAARSGPVLFVSMEMTRGQLGERLISMEAGVGSHTMRRGEMSEKDWERVADAETRIPETLIIDDHATRVAQVTARARQIHAETGGLELLVVDYLQLLAHRDMEAGNRNQQVGSDTWALRQVAADLGCPVLVAAQLNRGVESRSDKRPLMSDLRDSGEIEQHAALILGLYRDEVYHPASPDGGVAEFIVLKNRFGPTGTARAAWLAARTTFKDLGR